MKREEENGGIGLGIKSINKINWWLWNKLVLWEIIERLVLTMLMRLSFKCETEKRNSIKFDADVISSPSIYLKEIIVNEIWSKWVFDCK